MGGSSNFGGRFIPDLGSLMSQSEKETELKRKQTEVSNYLVDRLSEFNQRDTESISRHREQILTRLQNDFGQSFGLKHGGSYSRRTYVDGMSDIDILITVAELPDESQPGDSSKGVIREFGRSLRERYPETSIQLGRMAVTLAFADGVEIQVLPAFKSGDSFLVPDPSGQGWVRSNPKQFSDRLTSVNERCGGSLVPTIKLLKQICKINEIDVSSYHLEAMCVNIFSNYRGPSQYTDMLEYFLGQAKGRIFSPTRDITGQSTFIDSEILPADRPRLSRSFEDLERIVHSANQNPDVSAWKEILGKKIVQ